MTRPIGRDDPSSLWAPLDRPGDRSPILSAWDGDRYVSWTREDWHTRALAAGAALRRLGAAPGHRVLCVFMNSPSACAALLGVWLAGAEVVSAPLPARGMEPAAYASQLLAIARTTEPVVLLTDATLAPLLADLGLDVPVVPFQDLEASRSGFEPELPDADTSAFVQFSSGSTTEPKGCCLTPRAMAAQLRALQEAMPIDPARDVGVNWLPMSHDMGLFGHVLLSYWTGHHGALGTPQRFLADPLTWLGDIAAFRATVGATPPFALALVARRLRGAAPRERLTMRALVVGGERIDPATVDRFAAAMGGAMPATALMPSYGLAEAVLAVTMTPPGAGPRALSVDRAALEEGRVEHAADQDGSAVAVAGSGLPVGGATIRIDAPAGVDVGEIVVTSPSLADRYLGAPELTAARFGPDGLRTGDLGFLADGHLYVTGRVDDLIAVAGRNVYARDLELAAAAVDGVRPGRCAVVGVPDGPRQRLVALVAPAGDGAARAAIDRGVRASAIRRVGIGIDDLLFLDPGRLPKTPSGKVQRHLCRALALEGAE